MGEDMELRQALRSYTAKDNRLAYLSLLTNLAVYFAALTAAILAVQQGRWLIAAVAIVVLAFAGVRLYVLQHDLGHLSLFETTRAERDLGLPRVALHHGGLSPDAPQPQPAPRLRRRSRRARHHRDLHHDAEGMERGEGLEAALLPALPQPACADPGRVRPTSISSSTAGPRTPPKSARRDARPQRRDPRLARRGLRRSPAGPAWSPCWSRSGWAA